jgi:hypothetical protein
MLKAGGEANSMQDDQVDKNIKGMHDLDFIGWNGADWHGVFAHHHTEDVLVDWKGQPPTRGRDEHIAAMKAFVESAGGTPPQIKSHPIKFGSGEWTCSWASSKTGAGWSPSQDGATAPSPRNTFGLKSQTPVRPLQFSSPEAASEWPEIIHFPSLGFVF